MGTNLNARQFRQLCDAPRTVYLAFDADSNGSGQQAAQSLVCRLSEQGVNVRTVALPATAMIRTVSSSRAAMRFSSSRYWRRRKDDLPRGSQALPQPSCDARIGIVEQATSREIDWINQYLDYEKPFAVWPTIPCELMRTNCCTFSAGRESVHHTDAVAKDALTETTLLD